MAIKCAHMDHMHNQTTDLRAAVELNTIDPQEDRE